MTVEKFNPNLTHYMQANNLPLRWQIQLLGAPAFTQASIFLIKLSFNGAFL